MSKPKVFRYTVVEHIVDTADGYLIITYDAEERWRIWSVGNSENGRALRSALAPGDTIKITLEKLP